MPAEALDARDVREAACFPLVPYSNRMAGGALHFRGERFDLKVSSDAHRQAIHGVGWLRPWRVVNLTARRCTIALDYSKAAGDRVVWPFRFQACQTFTLDEERLTVELSVQNTDDQPMPAGLGLHPYFPKTHSTRLRFGARQLWRNEDGLPQDLETVSSRHDHTLASDPSRTALDTMFEGWDGTADIIDRASGLTLHLRADGALDRLIVFTPPGKDWFALEPVSHVTDAFNRPDMEDSGTRVLEPRASIAGGFILQVAHRDGNGSSPQGSLFTHPRAPFD